MAAEIATGWAPVLTGIELKTGTKGIFKVLVDGETVFDKDDAGHLPRAGELAQILRNRLGPELQWRQNRARTGAS